MQKKTKKIIMLTILLLIILAIILLIQNTTKQIPQPLIEQAKAEYTTQIGNQTYDITNAVLEPNEITPTISAGMIPIKWNGTNFVITTFDDPNWYDYSKENPAYIMLNDGTYQSELIQDMTGKELAENSVGNDALVVPNAPNNNPTIYMFIPRFAYNTQGEILYIKQGCSVAGTYTMPEIFTYQTEKKDFSLAGIWIEYTPLSSTSTVNTKVSNMQGENNKYGFIANTIGVNANNEPSYKTTIETYIANIVGNDAHVVPQITDISNPNRTILKITNSNQLEPIKGKANYDKTEEKIKIEVTYRTNAITKILDSKGKILSEISTTADTGDEIIGNKTYRFIIIDNLGNQKQIETTVTGLDVYIIENEDDLKLFRDAVNAGKTTTSTKAYQIADVKMNEGKYTIDQETGDITFASDAEKWVPIGRTYGSKDYIYQGIYYGNNHTISGMYINTTATNQGLFSKCKGTTINDLGIMNSEIMGGDSTGSIVGYVNGASINNCYSMALLNCNANKIGGIVGEITTSSITLQKCYSKCKITLYNNKSYIGGMIGYAEKANINNCYSETKFEKNTNTSCVAGIVAYLKEGTILNSYNTGDIICTGTSIAGICGATSTGSKSVQIQNCYNKGKITGSSIVAGISGQIMINSSATISNCKNYGDISGSYSGGIVGRKLENGSLSVIRSGNIGTILNASCSGGIIGYSGNGSSNRCSISMCYNEGTIIGTNYIGGMQGNGVRTTINQCYNIATIRGTSYIGGISGGSSQYSKIKNSYNIGNILGVSYVGGISGDLHTRSDISNCYNIGNVNSTSTGTYIGGIGGRIMATDVSNCHNSGNINSNGNDIGGIAGYQAGSRSGNSVTGSDITYCYNASTNINGKTYVGAICGYQNTTNGASVSSSGYLRSSSSLYGIAYDYNTGKYNINTGCSIYTSLESMPTVLSIVNGDNAFVEDTEGINNGYPLLAWQVEASD